MKFESRNPFSDEHILTHEYDTREEIMSKIIEAKNAYIVWNKLTIEERATHIFKFAVKLEEQREVVAQMITLETAKPINQSYAEIDKCIITIKYFVDHAKDFLANTIINEHAHLQYDSLGVLFGIMPWNFPLWQALRFAIPSLLAGNVVLVKPAPNTATCSLFIEKIFVLTGIDLPIYTQIYSKIEDIEFIISNEYIQGVSLTGSTEAGRSVAQICAKYFKKYVLELGGNDPFIVLEDADIQQAVHMAIESRVRNNGQSCIAAKRFIIHEKIYDDFIHLLIHKLDELEYGIPTNKNAYITCIARADLKARVDEQLEELRELGYIKIYEHERIAVSKNTVFPMIYIRYEKQYEGEIFAPIFLVEKFATTQEAIIKANNTSYGLGASVWTTNKETATHIATQLSCGMVYINEMTMSEASMPFGGIKNSGIGKELGMLGIREFVNTKLVYEK